jgi:hypothetical protein
MLSFLTALVHHNTINTNQHSIRTTTLLASNCQDLSELGTDIRYSLRMRLEIYHKSVKSKALNSSVKGFALYKEGDSGCQNIYQQVKDCQ